MKLTKAQREHVRARFNGNCAYCGCPLPERWHADHLEAVERKLAYVQGKGFVPTGELWKPENDCLDNMMPSCPPCNIDKHSMKLEDWRGKLQRSLDVLKRNSPTYRHALRFGLLDETPEPIVFYFERLRDYKPWPQEQIDAMRKWAKESDERYILQRADEIRAAPLPNPTDQSTLKD